MTSVSENAYTHIEEKEHKGIAETIDEYFGIFPKEKKSGRKKRKHTPILLISRRNKREEVKYIQHRSCACTCAGAEKQ